MILYYLLFQDRLSTSNQAREFKRSQSNNDDDPNSSFMDYDEDDEYDDNSENLNYLDLMNNRKSFDETIRNFKNGINRVRVLKFLYFFM